MSKFMNKVVIPLACYIGAYLIMDMSLGKEIAVGSLFLAGAFFSFVVGERS